MVSDRERTGADGHAMTDAYDTSPESSGAAAALPRTLRCHHCGYALTGLRGDGRCPECGAFIADALHVWKRDEAERRIAELARASWSPVPYRAAVCAAIGCLLMVLFYSPARNPGFGPLPIGFLLSQIVATAAAMGAIAFLGMINVPPLRVGGLIVLGAATLGIGVAIATDYVRLKWHTHGSFEPIDMRFEIAAGTSAITMLHLVTTPDERDSRWKVALLIAAGATLLARYVLFWFLGSR